MIILMGYQSRKELGFQLLARLIIILKNILSNLCSLGHKDG